MKQYFWAAIFLLFSFTACNSDQPIEPSNTAETPAEHLATSPRCSEMSGELTEFKLPSDEVGLLDVNVYLPPCYHQSNAHYPVIYLLHGGGLNEDTWFHLGAGDSADKLAADGQISPMIIVSPYLRKFTTSEQYDTFIIDRLIPHIDANYRTAATRENRILAGMSLGGWHTASIGFRNPDLFVGLGILSVAPVYNGADNYEVWLDAISLEQMPAIYLDVGDSDSLVQQQDELHQLLDERAIVHENHVRSGGHTLSYWKRNIDAYILWFGSVFSQ